jgi:outer membrane protein assembly factor BamA
LEDGERLLTSVKVKSEEKLKEKDELKTIPKQQPNRKLLGIFKIYLGIYNLYYHKENSKIKDKIGEPPVIYDSTYNVTSADLMSRYLNNKGYYDNTVRSEAKLKKKRANVTYIIDKGKRYKIQQIAYELPDPDIKAMFLADSSKSLIKIGSPLDLELLKKERIRIERLLKNNGYYKFSREYVIFKADTFFNSKSVNLRLSIKNPVEKVAYSDSLIEKRHQRYTISKVYVRMDYTNLQVRPEKVDTLHYDSLLFVNLPVWMKEKAIGRIIELEAGKLYRLDRQEQTYRNLSALRIFSYVSIQYESDYSIGGNNLVAYIDLNRTKRKSLTIETEGTNNGGNLGLNGSVNFQNNNTFGGAELLNISLSGGLEAQQILTENNDDQVIDGFLPFNTVEFGPEVSLEVPRFLLPLNADRFSVKGNPRTTFNASYNFQERPDYRRNVTKTYIAYSWNETATKTHIVQPFDLSYIKLYPSEEFRKVLESIENPFLVNSYTDNLIMALKYSFILNTKTSNRLKNYLFFRGNLESAGNTLSLLSDGWNDQENSDGSKEVAGIRYAQYVKTDVDFRFYQNFNYNQLVYRFAAGLGIPYGNSVAMPFEKSFYAGGANGIRAWRARELGPGNLPDSIQRAADQIGNMSLEGNLELRFPITSLLEGAAFLDAGNIWNLNQKDSRESTDFELSSLWRGTAIGVGSGIRFNFNFFILRLDLATRLKDPALEDPNELKIQWKKTNLNLGIGYPF